MLGCISHVLSFFIYIVNIFKITKLKLSVAQELDQGL